MINSPSFSQPIIPTAVCVLIPTYNNAKTLKRVLDGVLAYTTQVIVVNDGSTDATAEILANYPSITVLHLEKNSGKGKALRIGFDTARKQGFQYAITIDSDGQHFPDDIPTFIDALNQSDGNILLIGERQMDQAGIPKKSSFGNKFSNFWFWFETGIKLADTQSGYRLYPLDRIPKKLYTNKFELEIEVIVRSAWKDIVVKNVPIKILYDPTERVSHFRPFKDFTRISILNTFLVLISLLYIFPRNAFRSFKKKSFKDFLKEDILGTHDSNFTKSISIALGVFIGIAPLWGFQSFLSIFLASVFRLNKGLCFAFSNVSIPPMIPLIIWGSIQTGKLFISSAKPLLDYSRIDFQAISEHFLQYVLGSLTLALVTAVLFGLSSFTLLRFNQRR
jgi:glycosyltransferase involved in cell wall biosynthesis